MFGSGSGNPYDDPTKDRSLVVDKLINDYNAQSSGNKGNNAGSSSTTVTITYTNG